MTIEALRLRALNCDWRDAALMVNINLSDLLSPIELPVKLLGLSTRPAVSSGGLHARQYVTLLVLLYLVIDLIYTVALYLWIPSFVSYNEYWLYAPDINRLLLNDQYYLLIPITIVMRINTLLAALRFYLNKEQPWLTCADDILRKLRPPKCLRLKLKEVATQCQRYYFALTGVAMSIMLVQQLSIPVNHSEGQLAHHWHSHLHLLLYMVYSFAISGYALARLYLLCHTAIAVFDHYSRVFHHELASHRNFKNSRFALHLRKYNQLALFRHYLSVDIRRSFLQLVLCYMPLLASFYYNINNGQLGWPFKTVQAVFFALGLGLVLLYSALIGRMEPCAVQFSDYIYYYVAVKRCCLFPPSFSAKLIHFFHHIEQTDAGLTLVDQPININSSITILTIFLTLVTFMLSTIS